MTQISNMPHVHEVLEEMDSDPMTHLIAEALPKVIAAGVRAWNDGTFTKEFPLEKRVEATLNAMAVELLEYARSVSTKGLPSV